MKKSGILFALCVLFLAPAFAAEQSHILAAEKLMEVTNVEQSLEQLKPHMDKMFDDIVAQQGVPHDDENIEAFMAEVKQIMHEAVSWEAMKGDYVRIYVNTFSETELNDIIAFYQTPVGQMTLEKMPKLMQETMTIVPNQLEAMRPKLEEAQQRLQQRLRAEKQ